MDTDLELVPATRAGVKRLDGTCKSQRHFFDFVLNGESLWERIGKPRDTVSILCVEYAIEETVRAVNRLLLLEKADLPNDRRSLFICSECGDIACGAITLVVRKVSDSIVWEKFGYENTYEEEVLLDDYIGVGPFTFNAAAYERTLLQAVEKVRVDARGSRGKW